MVKKQYGFNDFLAGIVGFLFLVLILQSYTSLNLNNWILSVTLILTGGGFLVLGQIASIGKWAKDGIQKQEIGLLVTIIIGFLFILAGGLLNPMIGLSLSPSIKGGIGLLAIVGLGFTLWEAFVNKG